MLLKSLKKWLVAVSLVLAVPAFADSVCDPNTPVVVDKTLSGYVIAAGHVNYISAICFDNGYGDCDPASPQAVLPGNGSYSITLNGDVAGKRLLAKITANSTDSGNVVGQFTVNFTLAATVTGPVQNITPFTTALIAQDKIGKTPGQALTAIRNLVGSSTFDPQSDYVVNTNATAAAAAKDMIWRTISFTPGTLPSNPITLPWNYMLAAMNAYAAVGNTSNVVLNDILYQLDGTTVNASSVLADSLYDVNGDIMRGGITQSTPPIPSGSVTAVREKYALDGSTLSVREAAWLSGAWTTVTPAGGFDGGSGDSWKQPIATAPAVWAMKTDGTWVNQPTGSSLRPSYTVNANGSAISGIDSITGDTVNITYRSFDASNLPLSIAPKWMAPRATMQGTFPQGTKGYLATFARTHDQVVLTGSGLGQAWYDSAPHFNTAQIDGQWTQVLDKAGTSYTSVLDAVGMSMTYDISGCYLLTIQPDNTFTINKSGYNPQMCQSPFTVVKATFPVTGTWSIHPLNSQVIQLNIPKEMYDSQLPNAISSISAKYGWPIVIAFYQGHLVSGFMKPAGTQEVTRQFSLSDSDAVRVSMVTAGSLTQYPPQNK